MMMIIIIITAVCSGPLECFAAAQSTNYYCWPGILNTLIVMCRNDHCHPDTAYWSAQWQMVVFARHIGLAYRSRRGKDEENKVQYRRTKNKQPNEEAFEEMIRTE